MVFQYIYFNCILWEKYIKEIALKIHNSYIFMILHSLYSVALCIIFQIYWKLRQAFTVLKKPFKENNNKQKQFTFKRETYFQPSLIVEKLNMHFSKRKL